MRKRRAWAMITAAILAVVFVAFFWPGRAFGGIGPSGFAFYARQGIVNEINRVYGKGNSPYVVTCTEVPNYRTISDIVTCHVREP